MLDLNDDHIPTILFVVMDEVMRIATPIAEIATIALPYVSFASIKRILLHFDLSFQLKIELFVVGSIVHPSMSIATLVGFVISRPPGKELLLLILNCGVSG